jgi:hypothetical protein
MLEAEVHLLFERDDANVRSFEVGSDEVLKQLASIVDRAHEETIRWRD